MGVEAPREAAEVMRGARKISRLRNPPRGRVETGASGRARHPVQPGLLQRLVRDPGTNPGKIIVQAVRPP
ncbi:hypothetical protein BH20ACT11_BH20ACT11_10670 [soil metagenome]